MLAIKTNFRYNTRYSLNININGLEKSIDLKDISAGNYILTVMLNNGIQSTQKIVKR
ncbi:MAG: T9SS type A sorting domain-containing protein [Bacteroidales bacterium]